MRNKRQESQNTLQKTAVAADRGPLVSEGRPFCFAARAARKEHDGCSRTMVLRSCSYIPTYRNCHDRCLAPLLSPTTPQECNFEGRPTPMGMTANNSSSSRGPASVGPRCLLRFTGVKHTSQDLRNLLVTVHFGVDSVHKVGKDASAIQASLIPPQLVIVEAGVIEGHTTWYTHVYCDMRRWAVDGFQVVDIASVPSIDRVPAYCEVVLVGSN